MSGHDWLAGLSEGERLAREAAARLDLGPPDGTPPVEPLLTARCGHCKKNGRQCRRVVLRVYPTSVGDLAVAYSTPSDGHGERNARHRHEGHTAWVYDWVNGPHYQPGARLHAPCRYGCGAWMVDLGLVAEHLQAGTRASRLTADTSLRWV